MVGIVIVSHSRKLAEGVVELARMMSNAPIIAAGGLEDGEFGTSYEKIWDAIEEVYTRDGVVVLVDIGSAVMTTEMVLEDLARADVVMLDCPLVEGAMLVAVESMRGCNLQDLMEIVEKTRGIRKF